MKNRVELYVWITFNVFVAHACLLGLGGYAHTDHIKFHRMKFPDFEEDQLDPAKAMTFRSYGIVGQ